MIQFEYKKSKIISVNTIDFKQRYFFLSDGMLNGSDQGIIATFEDGNVEILYLDCENIAYSHSSESTGIFNSSNIHNEMDKIIKTYLEDWGCPETGKIDSSCFSYMKSDFEGLGLDLSLLNGIQVHLENKQKQTK